MGTPSLTVDLVQFTLILCALLMSVAFAVTFKMRFARSYVRLWNFGGLAVASGMTLVLMRGEILDFVSIVLGNLTLIAGYTVLAVGTKCYAGRSAYYDLILGALFAMGFVVASATGGHVASRIIVFSFFSIMSSASMFFSLRRMEDNSRLPVITRLALVALPINALAGVIRTILAAGLWLEFPVQVVLTSLLALGVLSTLCLSVLLVVMTVQAGMHQTSRRTGLPPLARIPSPSTGSSALDGDRIVGDWHLLQSRCSLIGPRGNELKLTGNEYLLLQSLFTGCNRPVPRSVLNASIGRDASNPKDRSVDVIVSRLRRKCAEMDFKLPVQSVRGRGYVFHAQVQVPTDGHHIQ